MYMYVRYTSAVRNLFPEGQQPKGYTTNELQNIAGVYLKIWMCFIQYIDEVYMKIYKPAITIAA